MTRTSGAGVAVLLSAVLAAPVAAQTVLYPGAIAYDAGPTAVARAGGAPSAEVLIYVANVTALWRRLNGCR